MGRNGFGLRMLQKYQEDYIKLTPRGRMKVKAAAVVCDKKQVFCKIESLCLLFLANFYFSPNDSYSKTERSFFILEIFKF